MGEQLKGARTWSAATLYQRRAELIACAIQLTGFHIGLLTDLGPVALMYAVTGLLVSETLGYEGALRRWAGFSPGRRNVSTSP